MIKVENFVTYFTAIKKKFWNYKKEKKERKEKKLA